MDTLVKEVASLTGPELRLALASTLKLEYTISIEPVYQVGARILLKGKHEFFRPDQDWKQAGPLIETHWVAITKWLQKHFGHTWVGYVDRSKESALTWFMRAIVGYYNPELKDIHFEELDRVN